MSNELRSGGPGYWRIAIVITLFLFVDGFDLFLLGKVAPAIAEGFGRDPAAMELVFTWHQVGLAVGAFVIPLLADRFGAKRLLVIMAALFGIGNVASAFVSDFLAFALLRGACGVFMAGAMPVGLALLSENVPKERLGVILSVAMVGMSVGAAANSIVPALMLDRYGWESGFILGGMLPILLIPLLIAHIPESSRFLRRSGDLRRDGVLRHLALLFTDRRASMTLIFWSIVFLSLGQNALVAVWLPTFFQELGGIRIQDFAVVAALTAIGGALGTLAAGWFQDRFGQFLVTGLFHIAYAIGLILLGTVPFGTLVFASVFVSWAFFQSASIASINLLLFRLYPVEMRATGSGWAAGMGRIAGMFAPAAGAWILVSGWGLPGAMAMLAMPLLFIAMLLLPLLAWSRRKDRHPGTPGTAHTVT